MSKNNKSLAEYATSLRSMHLFSLPSIHTCSNALLVSRTRILSSELHSADVISFSHSTTYRVRPLFSVSLHYICALISIRLPLYSNRKIGFLPHHPNHSPYALAHSTPLFVCIRALCFEPTPIPHLTLPTPKAFFVPIFFALSLSDSQLFRPTSRHSRLVLTANIPTRFPSLVRFLTVTDPIQLRTSYVPLSHWARSIGS